MPRHLLALALGTLSLGIAEFSMMSILSNVAESLAVSIPEAGHFISAYALGVCAGVAVMVVAARGIALSRMLYILAGLIFAGNLFAALAFDYWSMLAARFIAGLPHGAYFGVGAIVAISLAAPGQASRDVCLMVTGMTIANLVGVPLGSFLAWSLSWRATFAVVACAALLLILALRLWMPHVPALPNKGFRAQFRFLGHLTPWLVLGAIGLGNGGFFACYSYVNPIMETVAGVPASLMSAVIALAGFGMVAGNLLSARLAGRFSDQALACSGQCVLFLSLAGILLWAPSTAAAVILTTVAAGCVFFVSGPEQVMILTNAREGQLLAAALGQTAFNFGNAVGAWLGGMPIDAGRTAEWSALPGCALAFTGFLLLALAWWIHLERKR
ncbi:MAG: MFS transporter [Sutterella wadsworthensis]|nr:MFS transporter [Sutterella wadsworthensis]